MEEQVTRFPHVAVKIFDFLDFRSLAKSRQVCNLWKRFIESSKFFWVKFIKGLLKQSKQNEEMQRQWNRVMFMASIKQIIRIAVSLEYTMCIKEKFITEDFSPLHVLAETDSVNLYKDLCKTIPNDKINPFDKNDVLGDSCLHIAARKNNVDLFSFIIKNVKEKNPRAKHKEFDITPLHLAAFTGKLEICKIIIENVVDLSCLDEKYRGQTPFEYARSHNQLEICYYFNEVRNQSTFDIGWRFHKNIGTCFPEMSESRAITATTTATSTATSTDTTSFWSLFWNKYMKN